MSINRVVISGNLTRDPELRSTPGGTQVLSLSVAVNDRRRNPQTSEWEDYANFVDCKMFGARAESVSRFLSKGQKVCIEGKLRYSSWERDGQKRSKLEVVVDDIEFMSSNQGGNGSGGYASPRPQQAFAPQQGYGVQQGYAPQQAYAPQQPAMPSYDAYAAPQVPAPVVAAAPAAAVAPAPVAPASDVVDTSASVYDEEIPF